MVGCCAHGHETSSFIKYAYYFLLASVFPKEAANNKHIQRSYFGSLSTNISVPYGNFLITETGYVHVRVGLSLTPALNSQTSDCCALNSFRPMNVRSIMSLQRAVKTQDSNFRRRQYGSSCRVNNN